jgi:ribosome recycling factor
MNQVDELLVLIEEMRKKLYDSAKNKELTSPEVTKASQDLDNMLNAYVKLLRDKYTPKSQ